MKNDPRLIDLTGRRYGILTVISREPNAQCGNRRWLCRCDCGTEKVLLASNLARTQSCGCLKLKLIGDKKRTHGQSKTQLYGVWNSMHMRCSNPDAESYPQYGGRGIKVCDRWKSFENFRDDMGERPRGASIERDDYNADYSPSNCRWASAKEQGRNKSNNALITAFGQTRCLTEWAEVMGFPHSTLKKRYHRGVRGEEIFSERNRKNKSRSPKGLTDLQGAVTCGKIGRD